MNAFLRKKYLVILSLALATSIIAACGDDPVEEEDPADSIVTMTLLVGNQTIIYSKVTSSVTGGPIVIGAGNTVVSVSFKDAAGATVTGLDAFELRVTPTNTALVTFASTGKFTGTLTKVGAGSTQLSVQLWHVAEGHADVETGPIIPITIQ